MKQPTCSRSWEVEAARDGRLSGDALASHEEHVARCRECERERRALTELAAALQDSTSTDDEVALRRTRRVILQRADEVWHASPRSHRLRWVIFAASVTAAALTLAWFQSRDDAPPRNAATVSAGPDARWKRSDDPTFERIALYEGEFEVIVERYEGDRPVRLSVPEGEIEDVGTAFSVSVRAEHTLEIRVHAGSVIFHRRGMRDARVWAGEQWHAPSGNPIPADEAHPESLTDPNARTLVSPKAGAAPGSSTANAEAAEAGSQPETTTEQTKAHVQTGAEVPRTRGRSANVAAGQKPSRLAAHAAPAANRDSYREDASYLRILSLMREGRVNEARAAALAYAKEFPQGFRRAEVDRILLHPTTSR